MNENPYSAMINIMKEQGKVTDSITIGTVTSSSPLAIKMGDLLINKDNILVSDHLLKGHRRKVSISGDSIQLDKSSASGNTAVTEGHSHPIESIGVQGTSFSTSESSYIQTEDTLKQGDRLAILQTDDAQLYIVIARLKGV